MSFRKKMILCFALCLQHGLCHCIGNGDGETPEMQEKEIVRSNPKVFGACFS
jgi:hypothetical protein